MNVSALLEGARHVTVTGVKGVPPTYKARDIPMPSSGVRGPTMTAVVPDYMPDIHVHVLSIPKWLAWSFAAGLIALLGVGVWIGVEMDAIRVWTRSSAQTLGGK